MRGLNPDADRLVRVGYVLDAYGVQIQYGELRDRLTSNAGRCPIRLTFYHLLQRFTFASNYLATMLEARRKHLHVIVQHAYGALVVRDQLIVHRANHIWNRRTISYFFPHPMLTPQLHRT